MTNLLRFTVYGEPRPQGSKRAFPVYKDGKPLVRNGRIVTRVADDNPHTQDWRQQVASVARVAKVASGETELWLGPVALTLTFVRSRPKGHFGTGKNAAHLKASAPPYPTTKPDTTKLTRAIEDALTGAIWRDDSQVVIHSLRKEWGEQFAVIVMVAKLEDGDGQATEA